MIAPVVLKTLTAILDVLPIAYVIRIDTSDSKMYQQSRPNLERAAARDESPIEVMTSFVDS